MLEIERLLKNKTSTEKHLLKTDEHCAIKPFNFEKDDFEIDVISIEKETKGKEAGLLKVVVDVKKGGENVFIDNPLYFQNPPIMVPDGTTRTVVQVGGEFDGKKSEVPNYKVDVKQALMDIVFNAVRVTYKNI